MTFASAQLYLRDIEIIYGMPVCGNRSDVVHWNVKDLIFNQKKKRFTRYVLGICLFSFHISLFGSVDCYDCMLRNYYCHYLEERFSG